MLNFIITPPTRPAICHHYNTGIDDAIESLLFKSRHIQDEGWDVAAYFEQSLFLHHPEPIESIVDFWLADHLYGGGDIQVDPAWMEAQLRKLDTGCGLPDLDALMSLHLWAWWREHTLKAQIVNQRRGVPLGTPRPAAEATQTLTDYLPLPLHKLSGTVPEEGSVHLWRRLHWLVARVRACLSNPLWVLLEAEALSNDLLGLYGDWVEHLRQDGVEVDFHGESMASARQAMAQPMVAPAGYVGPLYKFGVSFSAGSFLVAQAAALDAQNPEPIYSEDID